MEADILVVDASKVAGWQGAGTQPPFPELYVLIEAKDHTAGVGRMEGKSFIGICQQLRRQPCVEAFVSSTSISPNAITVLNNNGSPFGRLECYERVSPLPADTAHRAFFVRDLATRMAARL